MIQPCTCQIRNEETSMNFSARFDIQYEETGAGLHCNQHNLWTSESQVHDVSPAAPSPALVAALCLFLLWLASTYILQLSRMKAAPLGHSLLNATKATLSVVLCLLALFDACKTHQMASEKLPTHLTTAYGLRAATMLIAAVVQQMTRWRGWRSCTLITYWLQAVLASPTVYWPFEKQGAHKTDYDGPSMGTSEAHAALVLIQLVLSYFGDYEGEEEDAQEGKTLKNVSKASFLSMMTFGWITSVMIKGYKKPVEMEDLVPLMEQQLSSVVVPKFQHHFDVEIQKCLRSTESQKSSEGETGTYKPNIVKVIFKAFGLEWGFACFIGFLEDASEFLKPVLLKEFITFINTPEEPSWKGFALAAGLYIALTTKSLLSHQWKFHIVLVCMKIKGALKCALYRKALKLSNAARQRANIGEVVNLMHVDVERFEDNATLLPMMWSAPLQFVISLYLLWSLLGPSVLTGLIVMIVLIPINGSMAKKSRALQEMEQKHKDGRMKLMNEVLNGIKVLKLYAWEKSIHEKVLGIRNMELDLKKTTAKLGACSSIFGHCSTTMISLATFSVCVLSSPDNILDAQKIFVSMSLFHMLQGPIGRIPYLVTSLSQMNVSIKRLQEFFGHEELDETNVVHINSGANAMRIVDGTFSWNNDEEEPTLKNVNIVVREGSLVAVVGAVGSGKSSLLSALLGEMRKVEGTVKVKGSIAYVPQQAWIQNATLRDNILFHNGENDSKYKKAVEACALLTDFDILTDGDQTEIGEKGINLSGGQKQRVSLARAVYSDNDIYLLDDPLSAVDAHVGKHIFDNVIGPEGMLKQKTRVLVTHGVSCLQNVDEIIVIKDGTISEIGSYTELLRKEGAFAEFLNNYAGTKSNKEEGDGHKMSENKTWNDRETKVPTGKEAVKKSSLKGKSKLIKNEIIETGGVKLQNIVVYMQSFGIWIGSLVILCQVLVTITNVLGDVWLSSWINDTTNSTGNPKSEGVRHFRIVIYGLIGLCQAAVVSTTCIVAAIGSQRASRKMHSQLLMTVLCAPMSFFETTPVGRIINRFSKDIDTIDYTIPCIMREVVIILCSFISTISVIAYSTPFILVVMVPFSVIYFFIQRFYSATNSQVTRILAANRSPVFSHFGETMQGAQTIRAYGQIPCFTKQSQDLVDLHHICRYNNLSTHRWLSIRIEGLGNILMLFTAIFAVFGRQHLTPNIVGLSITYSLHVTGLLHWFIFVITQLESQIVSVERVREYSEMKTEAPWVVDTKRPAEDWPQAGEVTFEKYSTRYREGLDLVLKDISCKVTSGERVGIVGRTGAGKSSLTLALFRIIEAAGGKITIDGINTSELGLHDLRSKITIIPQDPVLFAGSLRMNLDPFDAHTNVQLWTALEHAHLKSFVEGLSAGLEHGVSEGGENLSIGQRQLVCLARALLRKTKLLVLDEATAAVDLETDDLIQNTIRTKFADCTVFTIAHRLNTIMDYSKIMVFDEGHIKEFAAPNELLADKSSIFYGMAKDAGLVDAKLSVQSPNLDALLY